MALILNGSNNTIGGLAAGGLPDGCIVDADINGMAASKLSGSLPAISGASLTNLPAGGKFASYAIIADQKSQNTQGGSFTSGAWRTRDLNTEIADVDGIVSISSNQFTLGAGSYLIRGSASVYRTNGHQTRLYNNTNSSIVAVGTDEMSHASYYTMTRSFVSGRVTITGNTVFELQHRCANTINTYGYGQRNNFGTEQYALVEIFKES
mgnify:CR=1 FL=1